MMLLTNSDTVSSFPHAKRRCRIFCAANVGVSMNDDSIDGSEGFSRADEAQAERAELALQHPSSGYEHRRKNERTNAPSDERNFHDE